MVTSPEVLHAGTPTSLAVTCLADFPARVTAELAHSDTRVAQTEGVLTGKATFDPHFNILGVFFTAAKVFLIFLQGETKVLTLPPVSRNSCLFKSLIFT